MPDGVTGTRKRGRKGKAALANILSMIGYGIWPLINRVNAGRFQNLNRASPDSRIPWGGNILNGPVDSGARSQGAGR